MILLKANPALFQDYAADGAARTRERLSCTTPAATAPNGIPITIVIDTQYTSCAKNASHRYLGQKPIPAGRSEGTVS